MSEGVLGLALPEAMSWNPLFKSTTIPTAEELAKLVEVMPLLADRALEAPKFFKTEWRVNQKFAAHDDPDRMLEQWQAPDFVKHKHPMAQALQTELEELKVPSAVPNKRFARVVRNVMDQEDCAALLAKVNGKGFTPALVNVGNGVQQLKPELRDGHRIIVDSPELVAWLLEVIRPHLPAQLPNGLRLVGLNERCRFLCYTPGQSFEEHEDGCYRRPGNHPQSGDCSYITVQLYLHDIPASHGGATTFFPGRSFSVLHQPAAGSVLLFSQDLSHEGTMVRKGLKYTLRTEAMYTKRKDDLLSAPRWSEAVQREGAHEDSMTEPPAESTLATGYFAVGSSTPPAAPQAQTPPRPEKRAPSTPQGCDEAMMDLR